MAKRIVPTPEQLRELLTYNPETGKLFWKPRPRSMFSTDGAFNSWNARFANAEALTAKHNRGYRCGNIMHRLTLSHRAAWAVYYGEWPDHEVDHINGVRFDNRLSNLRAATDSEQSMNTRKRSDNTSGQRGVWFHRKNKNWVAEIHCDRRKIRLGSFGDLESATAAYQEAAKKYHGEFARAE